MAAGDDKKEPVFKELRADEPDIVPTEIESMCVNCGENVSFKTNKQTQVFPKLIQNSFSGYHKTTFD